MDGFSCIINAYKCCIENGLRRICLICRTGRLRNVGCWWICNDMMLPILARNNASLISFMQIFWALQGTSRSCSATCSPKVSIKMWPVIFNNTLVHKPYWTPWKHLSKNLFSFALFPCLSLDLLFCFCFVFCSDISCVRYHMICEDFSNVAIRSQSTCTALSTSASFPCK